VGLAAARSPARTLPAADPGQTPGARPLTPRHRLYSLLIAGLAPVFAVLAGALFLSEAVSATALLGLAMILAGSWLAAR
jgi:hypothetical protein